MAYVTKYKISFTNELSQVIEIYFNQKDGVGAVQEYEAVACSITYNGDEGKYGAIFGKSLEIEFNMEDGDTDYFEDFANADRLEWQVIVTQDGAFNLFAGWILPDEGGRPFQDRPYNCKISAVDGLGLLKESNLIKPDGTKFTTHHSIIEYLAAIFQATGLQLPIRVYDNVYHSTMQSREVSVEKDFVGQAYLEYRTFLRDATEFEDNYTCLERICLDNYRVFQYNGEWVLFRLSLLQHNPNGDGSNMSWTVYNYLGGEPEGFSSTNNYATVGKNEMIYPFNEDQIKYIKKASGYTKTPYSYTVWPELPKNNKFERGTETGSGIAYDVHDQDGDGDTAEVIGTYKEFTIEDWQYGGLNTGSLPAVADDASRAYRRSVYNDFNVETDREIILEEVVGGAIRGILVSEGMPVLKGDKIKISFDYKLSFSGSGTQQIAMMFLIPEGGGTRYVIESQNTSQMTPFYWQQSGGGSFISKFYDTGEDFNTYTGISIEPPEIPVNGTFYVGFITPSIIDSLTYIKALEIEYRPFVAGGYISVKGDYYKTTNDVNYPDRSEQEVFIADNPHKVFKGCLLDSGGRPFSADFHRYGVNESKRYTQLTNSNKFNLEQRRYWMIEGSFTGLTCAPQNNQTAITPLGLHYRYRFVDLAEVRIFMMGAPLEMDLITGNCTMRFYEVECDQNEDDGEVEGTQEYKYIF
jgi:hypothetical protein